MKTSRILSATAICVLAAAVSGCVVAPRPLYVEPVVSVAPAYASPGVGYVWVQHPRYGWGWRHHHHGWHHGWR